MHSLNSRLLVTQDSTGRSISQISDSLVHSLRYIFPVYKRISEGDDTPGPPVCGVLEFRGLGVLAALVNRFPRIVCIRFASHHIPGSSDHAMAH